MALLHELLLSWLEHPSIILLVVFFTSYTIYGAVWRLYFSPIAHFPGPKLAALTLWYELYYDLVLNGQYTFKLIELHKKYGPIIRISPWELHCADPSFYDEIYASSASGRKRNKYAWFTESFGLDQSMFATCDHDRHKIRRSALNPFFSMSNVRKLQPEVQERVNVMLRRINDFKESGEVLNASWMYAAFTNDVVMQYAFARSDHRLEAPDFDPTYRAAAFFGSTAGNFMKHAAWLNRVLQALPDWLVRLSHPAMAAFIEQKRNTAKQITEITTGTNNKNKTISHPTIFHEILNAKQLSEEDKSAARLSDEAQVLMMAGTLTTAFVFEVATFYLIRKPEILRKLKTELRAAIPDPDETVPLSQLEQLTYLNAIIKETLRLTYGVAGRLARLADEPLHYVDPKTGKEWTVPPHTPIGMSNAQLHHDESVFQDSWEYNPERWIGADGKLDLKMDKHLLSFTRGSRQCLGMPLSYAEMYLGFSKIWNVYGSMGGVTEETGEAYEGVRFDTDVGVWELYKTGRKDVDLYADSFLPLVKPGGKGIRVRISP